MFALRFFPAHLCILRGLLLALTLCIPSASAVQAGQVTVFAAASLRDALEEIATDFEAATGHEVSFSFAGSSVLARQIDLGAPADIFISANEAWMDVLEASGAIRPESRMILAGNSLVLIASDPATPMVTIDTTLDLAGMLGTGRLAMGLLEAVPAGIYGKQALEHFGLWDSVAAQVAQSDNVRATLALVATGEAPFGIVYATDTRADPRVKSIGAFPANAHDLIVYPAARTTRSREPAAAELLDYLSSSASREVLARHGFALIAERP
jgi:molybdate transport system substrate-binding protein